MWTRIVSLAIVCASLPFAAAATADACTGARGAMTTLADPAGARVSLAPRGTTVRALGGLRAPSRLVARRVAPYEYRVYSIRARLLRMRLAADGDVELVVADRARRAPTMIVRLPSRACTVKSRHRPALRTARLRVLRACGAPTRQWVHLRGRATLAGVVAFAGRRATGGGARNGATLDPLTRVRAIRCVRVPAAGGGPTTPAPNPPGTDPPPGDGGTSPLPPPASPPPAADEPPIAPEDVAPGWRLVFRDDFDADVPLGSFPAAVGDRWAAYGPGSRDTKRFGTYDATRTVSVANGLLSVHVHTANGVPYVAALTPRIAALPFPNVQIYGRYAIRFRADAVPGYKTVALLWPVSEVWPRDGEINFPEGALNWKMSAFMHHQDGTWAGDQDVFDSEARFPTWHTAVIEWGPTECTFILDGAVLGRSTERIPNTAMKYVLQTETEWADRPPPADAEGDVQIDWVRIWARV